jgi:predicted nucleotide-binding protein
MGQREDYERAVDGLREILVSRATGGLFDEAQYRSRRGYVLSVPALAQHAPDILRDVRSGTGWWAVIKPMFATYWERTQWIDEQFRPLYELLDSLPGEESSGVGSVSLDASQAALAEHPVSRAPEHRDEPSPSGADVRERGVAVNRRALGLPARQAADVKPKRSLNDERVRVFVVHGHDTEKREAVARYVEKLGFEAIVLAEQPNAGRTIIEKFEDYSNVAFAIVLMTPDDHGGAKGLKSRPRARQNVILELGFFTGVLGRGNVAALVVGSLETPSDVDGILYTPWDEHGAWRTKIAREMRASGLAVDLNRI